MTKAMERFRKRVQEQKRARAAIRFVEAVRVGYERRGMALPFWVIRELRKT